MNKILLFILLTGFMTSCIQTDGDDENTAKGTVAEQMADDNILVLEDPEGSSVYYGLYSPNEVARIFKDNKFIYDPSSFLDANNISKYTSSSKIAMNLGVYGADFSLATLYEDSERAMKYMETIAGMASAIGVPSDILQDSEISVQNNIGDIDSLVEVVAGVFANSSAYLIDAGRESATALVMMGGWLEGTYEAFNMMNGSSLPEPELVKVIAGQKYSLDYLLSFMKNHYSDPDIARYYRLLEVLANHYRSIEVYYRKAGVDVDRSSKTINADWYRLEYSLATLKDIKQMVSAIRASIVEV